MKPYAFCLLTTVLAVVPASLQGCGGHPDPDPLPPAEFIEYYAGETFLIEKSRLEGGDEAVLGRRLDSLRTAFGLSEDDRDSLLAWCRDSLPRWEAFLKGVQDRLESKEKEFKSAGPESGRTPTGRGE